MSNPILTIGVPTYNRPEHIQKLVRALLPQLSEQVLLWVSDNCSDIPVESLFTDEEKRKFKITRTKANIGGDANIAGRVYECDTKWVWTLGDDDIPLPNSVDIILNYIEKYPNELYLKFGSAIDTETHNLEEFVGLCINWEMYGNIMFISHSIYNCDKLREDLIHYYVNLSLMNGQVVFLLKHLERKNDNCLFISDKILAEHGTDIRLSQETFVKRSSYIFQLFPGHRKLFDRTIYATLARTYYQCVFFDNPNSLYQRFRLFIYILFIVGIWNSVKYCYMIYAKFLASLLMPKSLYVRVRDRMKKEYKV